MNKRLQAAEQLRRALQMFAQTLKDGEAMEIATVYPAYAVGQPYKTGDIFSYGENNVGDPQLYRVAQDHTSAEEWKPDELPALYTAIGITDDGYPVWAQPTGAQDAYARGDVVEHNGTLYRSTVDGNVWAPDVYGWETVTG